MIIRCVRMHFNQQDVEEFLTIFNEYKGRIRHAEGCSYLALLRDTDQPHILMTLSHWQDSRYLEHYRESELFKEVWRKVKMLFSHPPEAFSMEKYIEV